MTLSIHTGDARDFTDAAIELFLSDYRRKLEMKHRISSWGSSIFRFTAQITPRYNAKESHKNKR